MVTTTDCRSEYLLATSLFCCFMFLKANAAVSFTFVDSGQILGRMADDVGAIAIADVNNDGCPDLILASIESNTIIQLYLNDCHGYFTKTDDLFPVTQMSVPLWNCAPVVRDFNRDGLLDIGTADVWRGVNIYMNKGDKGFEWSQAITGLPINEIKGIDAADLDHDGDDDIVFGGHNGNPDRGDRIYFNDGTGYFDDSGQKIGNDVTMDVRFGDVNNDGNVDYISVNRYREHTSKVHINNGKGFFKKTLDLPTTETDDTYTLTLADLNMDGFLDVAIASSIDPAKGTLSKVFLNNGKGGFKLSQSHIGEPNCETKSIQAIDTNNDGYPDLVLGNWSIANMIYRNNGKGFFKKMGVTVPSYGTSPIRAADLNGDGFVDLVVGNYYDGAYRIYFNDGKGLKRNAPPTPPTQLSATVDGTNVLMSWNMGGDDKTPAKNLTYNVRVGLVSHGNDVVSGLSAEDFGHVGATRSHLLKGLKAGRYYWSVQSVDAGYKKSKWSKEAQFEVGAASLAGRH